MGLNRVYHLFPSSGFYRLVICWIIVACLVSGVSAMPLEIISCSAPCQCISEGDAYASWGANGYVKCDDDRPCFVYNGGELGSFSYYCFKKTAVTAVPVVSTTTPVPVVSTTTPVPAPVRMQVQDVPARYDVQPAGKQVAEVPARQEVPAGDTQVRHSAPPSCRKEYRAYGPLKLRADGRINCTVLIRSDDTLALLTLPAGTAAGDARKVPLSSISIAPVAQPELSSMAVSNSLAVYGWQCLPEGALFDPPIEIQIVLPESVWNTVNASGLEIRESGPGGGSWETLPTTTDPSTRTVSARVPHFSTLVLVSRNASANKPGIVLPDLNRPQPGTATASLPFSPYIPARLDPLVAVCTGIGLMALGALPGNGILQRRWPKLADSLQKSVVIESIGLIGKTEVEKRNLRPDADRRPLLFGFSANELLVIVASTVILTLVFILKDRLQFSWVTIAIFVVMGGAALIGHELGHHYMARRYGSKTELQFWTLGTCIMFLTAWFFGSVFAKPSRTVIHPDPPLPMDRQVRVVAAGPAMNLFFALVSLLLLPLGGMMQVAGQVGFAINMLLCVIALVPITPMEGKTMYVWNRKVWAAVFFPVIVFYLTLLMM